ncbi:MAG: discoidin domain-containing protein [Phycisphaerae bacterium]|nr:discoidin domain-containing protein [Phycisphaerae bacterium]
MSGRVIYCIFIVSLVGLIAGQGRAQIEPENVLGAWLLDEGSGDTTADASGNGHDGTLMNSPNWVAGNFGNALQFGGSTYVDCGSDEALNVDLFSVSFWCNIPNTQSWNHMISRGQHGASGSPGSVNWGVMMYDAQETILFETFNDTAWTGIQAATSTGEWHHVVATYDGDTMQLYHDGVLASSQSGTGILLDASRAFIIGGRSDAGSVGGFFTGSLDEVGYFNAILGLEDIQTIMNNGLAEILGGSAVAVDPHPAHGDVDVPRDPVLSWTPGMFAATHNVYIGTVFEEVDTASVANPLGVLASEGRNENNFNPDRLEFGRTYYWRVDEVNGTPDKTVYKGSVWSFTAEPYSIQIPIDINKATASSYAPQKTPALTVDGSGLNGMAHSAVPETMWLSNSPDLTPWLMYEFNRVEKLDQMLIWNANSVSESFVGWGVKDVSIEYSMDGVEWTALAEPTQLEQAPGLATYDTPQVIDFGLVAAQYVRLNIQSNWGGLLPQYGVSEVQFYGIPVHVREPMPASGSVNVRPDAVASWRPGRDAGQHTIYLDTDLNAVAEGLASSMTSMTSSVDLGAFDLQMGETYYWRVDEVNEAEVPSVWAGPVWSLSTMTALVVEDFERYGNKSPNRPFQVWLDGFGYSADEFFPVAYPGNGTGAGIGHDIWGPSSPYFNGNLMETGSTIAGSNQSMPFYYSNTGGVSSQTERTFAVPQDFTVGGAQTLSIAFRGQPGNTGTLYIKINNTKLVYPRDAANIALSTWQAWNIDLGSVNTNLQSVTKLQIGVDGSGAAGMLLIDDIRLHAEPGEVITPVDPGTSGLVAKFTFEGNMSDSSGNGHNGTVVGTNGTTIVSDAERGQVLSLPGGDDQYVAVGAVGISGNMPRTIACWAKAASTAIPDWTLIFGFTGKTVEDGSGGNGSHFNIGSLGGPGGIGAHCWGWEETMVSDQEGLNWHHYAMTYDGTTIAYFLDGIPMDSDPAKSNVQDLSISGDRVYIGSRSTQLSSFPGNVDDAVIYSRVLSAGEILSLAGKTAPVDKPF